MRVLNDACLLGNIGTGYQNNVSGTVTAAQEMADARRVGGSYWIFDRGSAESQYCYDTIVAKDTYYHYATMWIYIETSVNTLCDILSMGNGTTNAARLRLATNDTVELWNNTTKIGSSSSAIPKNTWTRVGLGAKNTGTCYGVVSNTDNTTFSSGTGTTASITKVSRGAITSSTGKMRYTDFIMNSNEPHSIDYDNDSWANYGINLFYLLPTGAGDTSTQQTGTWSDLGVGDTTYVNLATNGQEADFSIASLSDAVASNYTCPSVHAGYRWKAATAASCGMTVGLGVLGGGINSSATSTTLTTQATTAASNSTTNNLYSPAYVHATGVIGSSVVDTDTMQIGFVAIDANPDIYILNAWVVADVIYTESSFTPKITII